MREKMNTIAKTVGERIRSRRLSLGYSQEKTAEIAGLHPTYIGQLERGEKNATVESLEKVCSALQYPMDQLFQNMVSGSHVENFADKCYFLLSKQSPADQEQLYQLLLLLLQYKKKDH